VANAGGGSPRCPDDVSAWTEPVRWRRAFPGQAVQLRHLRTWVESLLPECPARDDVLSVASELAANAVQHTASKDPGGTFLAEVCWRREVVRVAVADCGSAAMPRVISDPEGEDGRGLMMVAALAIRTGVSGDQRGRTVWADVAWPRGYRPPLSGDLREAVSDCDTVRMHWGPTSRGLGDVVAGVPSAPAHYPLGALTSPTLTPSARLERSGRRDA
jgi:hypothetical protein